MHGIRRYGAALFFSAAVLGIGSAAHADTGPADADEMAQIFDAVCVHSFPDPGAVAGQAARLRARPMSAAQVQDYLHQDPGLGWYYTTGLAMYAITIERPPISACAVRRMTPTGLPSVKPYLAAVNGYAASQHTQIVNIPPRQSKTADGADISLYAQAIPLPGGKAASDVFMVVLTNYHGHFHGTLEGGAGAGPGVEVRFVRQIQPVQ